MVMVGIENSSFYKPYLKFDKNIIVPIFFLCILLGKLIRFTIMKDTLLGDYAVGNEWLSYIISNKISFSFFPDSFDYNAIFIYSNINFFSLTTYNEFEIYISIIMNLMLFFVLFSVKKEINIFELLFIFLIGTALNIFDFCLSKEPLQFIVFLVLMLILKIKISNYKKLLFSLIVLFLSAISLRLYYIFVIVYAIPFYFLFSLFTKSKKNIVIKVILSILILFLMHMIIMTLIKSIDNSEYNFMVYLRTVRRLDASSNIDPIIKNANNNAFLFSIEYLLVNFRLLFPLELIKLGPKYYPYVLLQVFLTFYVLKGIYKFNSMNFSQKVSLLLFVGLVFTSAMFEPDFGSWVRHEIATLPLLLIFSNYYEYKDVNYYD